MFLIVSHASSIFFLITTHTVDKVCINVQNLGIYMYAQLQHVRELINRNLHRRLVINMQLFNGNW